MSPEGCQAAWPSSLLPFGFEHAQYTPSAQALQKLLCSFLCGHQNLWRLLEV